MIKSELIARITERNPHLFAKDVEKAVNAVLEEVVAALVRTDRVELRQKPASTPERYKPSLGIATSSIRYVIWSWPRIDSEIFWRD